MTQKMRNCLKCNKSFLSEGSHNRICASCHKINNIASKKARDRKWNGRRGKGIREEK